MSVLAPSAWNVAHAVLIALESAEKRLMPTGARSRLFVAVELTRESLSYLSFDSEPGRVRLVAALDHVFAVQTIGRHLNQLPDTSIIARGLTLSIHVAHCALLGEEPSPVALEEARSILAEAEAS